MGRYEKTMTAVMSGSAAGILGLLAWGSWLTRKIEDQQEAFLEANRKAFMDEADANWEYHHG